jgi:hypothetical protein
MRSLTPGPSLREREQAVSGVEDGVQDFHIAAAAAQIA